MQFSSPCQVVERIQIKGAIFSDEFYIVIVTSVTDSFDNRWPCRVYVGAERGFIISEQLAELVRSDRIILLKKIRYSGS